MDDSPIRHSRGGDSLDTKLDHRQRKERKELEEKSPPPPPQPSPAMGTMIYHERQTRQLCGLHSLNNLFQIPDCFTKAELDGYCYAMTPRLWLNPHRSWIGWGNYDVNVIMYALGQRNCEAIWFDRRRDPSCLDLSNIFGFILNMPSQMSLGYYIPLPVQMRHWLALRCINGTYYNLDSKLAEPQCLGSAEQFLDFLKGRLLPDNSNELFIVMEATQSVQGDDELATNSSEILKQRWLLPKFRK